MSSTFAALVTLDADLVDNVEDLDGLLGSMLDDELEDVGATKTGLPKFEALPMDEFMLSILREQGMEHPEDLRVFRASVEATPREAL